MKVFLVATDLSERSDRAVRRALRLARNHGGRCHILHVVDDTYPADMVERIRADADARLTRFAASLDGGPEVTCSTVVGDPLAVVPQEARNRGADLVVFGLHRPRPFFDALRETTVERLLRVLNRPALVVRDAADHDYARVLAPVSFSPACAKALATARDLAADAEITAFHAIHLPFAGFTHEQPGGAMDRELKAEAEAARADWCACQGLPKELCAVTTITGSLGEVADKERARVKPDLIALGAHTRGRFAPYTLGSFATSLVRDPPTDLLLAHP